MTTYATIKEILVEHLGLLPEQVSPEASLAEDLGADSLDTLDLVLAFNEAFGINIPDADLEQLKTVQNVVDYVDAHAKKKAA